MLAMHPSSGIRRTNVIVRLEDDNVFKQYRNFPPVVMGQVLLRLRSPRALFGRHRCEVEEKRQGL